MTGFVLNRSFVVEHATNNLSADPTERLFARRSRQNAVRVTAGSDPERRGRPGSRSSDAGQWLVGVSFSMTRSRLKLAAFWRGGKSRNVIRKLPT